MGTRLVAGRDFTWDDDYGLHPMLLVSESFARWAWGSPAAAVGKRLQQWAHAPWYEVIGVVEDVHVHGVDEPAPATIYWPAMTRDPYTRQTSVFAPRTVTFAIRSEHAGEQRFVQQAEQAVWKVNSNLPVAQIQTMKDLYDDSMARTSFTLAMLAIAGSMALALSVIGIYGVIAYAVSQRTREIGIRLALGAPLSNVTQLFLRSGLILSAIGCACGLAAALVLTRLMKSLLFSVSPSDPLTYIAMAVALISAAALASYLPARKAVKVDPVEALRAE
jgi:hypothetical protein